MRSGNVKVIGSRVDYNRCLEDKVLLVNITIIHGITFVITFSNNVLVILEITKMKLESISTFTCYLSNNRNRSFRSVTMLFE